MPVFTIEAPGGKRLRIEAPDEAQAMAGAQQWHTEQQAAPPPGQPAAQPAAAPVQTSSPPMPGASLIQAIMGTSGQPAAPAPPPRTWGDTATDLAGDVSQLGRGVRKGFANLVGLPVDAINAAPMAANLLPGVSGVGPISQNPIGGSRSIDQALGAPNEAVSAIGRLFGADIPTEVSEPQNLRQRVVRRVGEEVGASAVPVAGAVRAGQMGVEAARELPLLARMMVEPAAIAPGSFAAKEAGTAVFAGAGAATANEITRAAGAQEGGLAHNLGDLGGALGGAAAIGTARAISKPLTDIFNVIARRDNFSNDVVQNAVVDRLANSSTTLPKRPGEPVDTQPLVDQIMNGPRTGDTIPGYRESLADRTADPGIAAVEYGRQSGPNGGLFTQARTANTAAVDNAVNASAPQGTPGALRSEMALERERRLTDASVQTLNAQDAAAQAVAPLTPQSTPAARGNTVRSALEDARDAARAKTEAAYADANVAGRQVDPTDLTRTLDDAVGSLTEVERGLVPQDVIDRVRRLGQPGEATVSPILGPDGQPITRPAAPPEPIALKEATDLRSELSRLQRAALADPRAERGGRNAARVLGQMGEAVDGFIGRSLPEADRAALETARQTKFNEAEAFSRRGDPVAAALARNEGGMPQMRDERVAGTFTNPQNMDRLFAQADTPQVRQAIREEVLSRGDTSSADRVRQFAEANAEQLDRFPGLRQELNAAARARETEAGAVQTERGLQRELGTPERPGNSAVGRYLQYGDERAADAMKGVMAAKEPGKAIDEMLNFVGNQPQAVEGARKAFWDVMQQRGRSAGETTRTMDGAQPWMPRALKAFLDDPTTAAVAERLYRDNPEHLANVRQIADALQNVDMRSRARAPATSGTAQGVSQVLSPETVQSRFYAYKRGQTSLGFMVTALASVAARRAVRGAQSEAIEKLLDRALLDPDLAAQLLRDNNPANRAALARTSKAFLGNEASTVIDILDGEDPDRTRAAVMRGGSNGR